MARSRMRPEELRSHRWFGGGDLSAQGHRSRALQMGYSREDFAGKPVIGIINTWSEINQCHAHFKLPVRPRVGPPQRLDTAKQDRDLTAAQALSGTVWGAKPAL